MAKNSMYHSGVVKKMAALSVPVVAVVWARYALENNIQRWFLSSVYWGCVSSLLLKSFLFR